MKLRSLAIAIAAAAGALLAGPGLPACSVPVFRFALENWAPEPYEAIVFHRGPLDESGREALEILGGSGRPPANCEAIPADLALGLAPDLAEAWSAHPGAVPPWAVVRAPQPGGGGPEVWAGALSPEAARSLVDSPARREIAARLCRGDAAVWILLECGDPRSDAAAAGVLKAVLARLEKEMKLPADEPGGPEDEAAEDGEHLGLRPTSAIPLRIAFSVLAVSRSDPAERFLAGLLLGKEARERSGPPVPEAFPVFGRGRVLGVLRGAEIEPGNIEDACGFLTGPCSCRIKGDAPGGDLLMAADWEAALAGRPAEPPPPLVGFGTIAGDAAEPGAPGGPGVLTRWLAAAAIAAAVILGAATLVVLRRSGGRRPS